MIKPYKLTLKKFDIGNIINNTCYNAVCPLNIFDNHTNLVSRSTGFIVEVINFKIIVVTCAHNILQTPDTVNSTIYPIITCTVTEAYSKDSKIKNTNPVAISLRLVGMDISADIAILCSILPGEETPHSLLSYQFSEKTQKLSWNTNSVYFGETVYAIGNMYGNNLCMLVGENADNNVVYLPESESYTNSLQLIITSLPVKGGASGSPVLTYDPELKKGVLSGIIQWSKKDNNYTAGLNTISLYKVCQKICQLNMKHNMIGNKMINFNGTNGKGYIGISTYSNVNGVELTKLCIQYPLFLKSVYRNQASGIRIKSLRDYSGSVSYGGIKNAICINKCDYLNQNKENRRKNNHRIKVGDIIMEIDGNRLGDENQDLRLSDIEYFNKGNIVFLKCLKPDIPIVEYYKCTIDSYPSVLERVSVEDSIELIEDLVWDIILQGTQPAKYFLKIPELVFIISTPRDFIFDNIYKGYYRETFYGAVPLYGDLKINTIPILNNDNILIVYPYSIISSSREFYTYEGLKLFMDNSANNPPIMSFFKNLISIIDKLPN